MLIETMQPYQWDHHHSLVVPGDHATSLIFCVEHWIALCTQAIQAHGAFYVALSGGSTPKALFERLTSPPYVARIPWEKVHLFWSDERAVPPTHPESNYHMAMQAGLDKLPIPPSQIHRMQAEDKIEENALIYERTVRDILPELSFDLVMLGMGEDGHTASLFPNTVGLNIQGRLVIANFVPEQHCWRMTFTFDLINAAHHIVIYVLGASKKFALSQVLSMPLQRDKFPVLRVGTSIHPALWICDESAASNLPRPA